MKIAVSPEQHAARKAWVAALTRGNIKQGQKYLHSVTDNSMCCLGVACMLNNLPSKQIGVFSSDTNNLITLIRYAPEGSDKWNDCLPDPFWFAKTYGITTENAQRMIDWLSIINDEGAPFSAISALIDRLFSFFDNSEITHHSIEIIHD